MKQKSGNKSTQQFAKLSPNKRVSVEKDRPPVKPLRHHKDKQDDLLPSSLTRSGLQVETAHAEHVMIPKKVIQDIHAGIANLEAAFGALANALRVLE